jgi:hypothetical protein
MPDNNSLSPNLLHGIGIVIVSLGALMVAVLTSILALAARRTGMAASAQFVAPLIAAALLGTWFGWAVLAVQEPVIVPEPTPSVKLAVQQPALLLAMTAMLLAGIMLLFASKTMRAVNAATPPEWPIAAETYRVAGVMFLWPFLAAGALPARFALPAGIGDFLTGIAAPVVALAVARNRPNARVWAVAWNCFGILDLIVAPVAAVLSHTTNIARFPTVIVPLFLGPPLGILTHVYSLRNLAVTRRRVREENAHA